LLKGNGGHYQSEEGFLYIIISVDNDNSVYGLSFDRVTMSLALGFQF